jgi:hypothetical protein
MIHDMIMIMTTWTNSHFEKGDMYVPLTFFD